MSLTSAERRVVMMVQRNAEAVLTWVRNSQALNADLIRHLQEDTRFLADMLEKPDEPEEAPGE